MTSSFFYLQAEKNTNNSSLINKLDEYANASKKQLYVIDRPLSDSKYHYKYQDALVLLAPNHKIIFVNLSNDKSSFEEYVDDFIEDLGSISDKYRYKEVIGRPRSWKSDLIFYANINEIDSNVENFLREHRLEGGELRKRCELLISLLTGSINDIEKFKGDVPDNILDKIKQKIILFDGDQTRFVYQQPSNKRITIQGLSGTGKTELLLHKLKEIYVENPEAKVIFTCHNKILAD